MELIWLIAALIILGVTSNLFGKDTRFTRRSQEDEPTRLGFTLD